ncbi:MAG: phosphatidylserine decarboxylase, partial [Hyphomicrobiaceae bacterium]
MSLLETIKATTAPVHRDGYKFLGVGAGLTLIGGYLWLPAGFLFALLTGWIAYFFRDPDRVTPLREGLVVAPADGRIESVRKVRPPDELGFGEKERVRVSIFLSVFDVHVNRAPVAGRIARVNYVEGAFFNAALDKASEENERRSLVIVTAEGIEIGVVQIAGLIARRIVPFVQAGDTLDAGQRIGLIRFGSRMDVYLPPGRAALVAAGQRAIAGETVLAD